MKLTETVDLPADPETVYPLIARLDEYPRWLRLVHRAEPLADDGGCPVWEVELRAQVGPFARSKQLRMCRTDATVNESATFERRERDGRDHANWTLIAQLEPVDAGTKLTMTMAYDGRLWTGGLLERVLNDEIERGRTQLVALLGSAGR